MCLWSWKEGEAHAQKLTPPDRSRPAVNTTMDTAAMTGQQPAADAIAASVPRVQASLARYARERLGPRA